MAETDSPRSSVATAPSSPERFCLDQDKIFREAEQARLEVEYESDEEPLPRDGVVATIYCRNGDIHRCLGDKCPLLQMDNDRFYVCPISNIVCGRKMVREDMSTGRMTGSVNPDDNASGGHSTAKTADSFAQSVKAFEFAESQDMRVDENSLFVAQKRKRKRRGEADQKRGARNVTEPPDEHKAKATRRTAHTTEEHALLIREAGNVLVKLVSHEKKDPKEKMDPRLMDANALFEAAVAKYLKTQQADGRLACLSEVHDLAITAARVAKANQKKQHALQKRSGAQALLCKASIRDKVVQLIVTLWLQACKSTYMQEVAKNSDSFRPFMSGALYALKRGVQLPTGEYVVPEVPELCEALPVLRATKSDTAAKSLHASSHKGLCCLHRSIASCSTNEEATRLFSSCIAQATAIREDVKRGNLDF